MESTKQETGEGACERADKEENDDVLSFEPSLKCLHIREQMVAISKLLSLY